MGSLPRVKINFNFDSEERKLIGTATGMTREQMWDVIENNRLEELKKRAGNLSYLMLSKARCPLCTLQPPCKHYKTVNDLVSEAYNLANMAGG